VVALDYFADTDLRGDPGVVRLRVGPERTTAGLGRAALALPWDACAFTGGLENRPGLLRLLSRHGTVLGPDPRAVYAMRRPENFFGSLAEEGIPSAPLGPSTSRALLRKPRRAAGGRGVLPATAGERALPGEFLQERLEGACGSAAFLADGDDAVLLGTSEQFV